MPWFVDVELVNPRTGDKVGKRLDFTVDVSGDPIESWALHIARAIEIAIRDLGKRAQEVEGKGSKA